VTWIQVSGTLGERLEAWRKEGRGQLPVSGIRCPQIRGGSAHLDFPPGVFEGGYGQTQALAHQRRGDGY
jgi:hypothetical protein